MAEESKNSFDKQKHKKEVNRLRAIKKQRRMKMRDRKDDVLLAPEASMSVESFCVDQLPQEDNQDDWLNELIDETPDKTPVGSPKKKNGSGEDPNECCSLAKYPAFVVGVAVALFMNYFLRRGG